MDVEVVDGQLVQPPQALIAEDQGREVLQLDEVVFRVIAVVGL